MNSKSKKRDAMGIADIKNGTPLALQISHVIDSRNPSADTRCQDKDTTYIKSNPSTQNIPFTHRNRRLYAIKYYQIRIYVLMKIIRVINAHRLFFES